MRIFKLNVSVSFLGAILVGLTFLSAVPASADSANASLVNAVSTTVDAASAGPLTLEGARSLALANSSELASLLLAAESSALDERLQDYESLPSLSLSSSASMQAIPEEGSAADTLSAGVSLSASQTLWSGGRNGIKGAIRSLATDAAKEAARARYFTVLDDIDLAWYSLLKSRAALDAAQASLGNHELALSMAEIRFEAGALSITDYLSAQSAFESARTSLSQARRDVALARLKVASLTGLSPDFSESPDAENAALAAHDGLIARIAGYSDADVEAFAARVRERAFASNPELSRTVIEGKKAEGELGLSKKEYLPSVSAGVSAGIDYGRAAGLSDPSVRLSLSGTIPMEFWKTRVSVDKSKLALRMAGHDLGKAKLDLEINLQTAVQNCVALARSVLSSGKALEYARKHYENKLEMFRLSAASASDLSDAAALVSSNESQLISARYGFLSCLSDIRTICALDEDAQVLGLIP